MESGEKLAGILVELLLARRETLATAESCTGGMVASEIVSIPGASEVFHNGFIVYCDEAKHRILGVSEETLEQKTAVSEETAKEMAEGCIRVGQADLALSVTGLAGPGGGTPERPVGLVYIGCCYHGVTQVRSFLFQGDRQQIRESGVCKALELGILCMKTMGGVDEAEGAPVLGEESGKEKTSVSE
jgi:PncC family amidohydrolase